MQRDEEKLAGGKKGRTTLSLFWLKVCRRLGSEGGIVLEKGRLSEKCTLGLECELNIYSDAHVHRRPNQRTRALAKSGKTAGRPKEELPKCCDVASLASVACVVVGALGSSSRKDVDNKVSPLRPQFPPLEKG